MISSAVALGADGLRELVQQFEAGVPLTQAMRIRGTRCPATDGDDREQDTTTSVDEQDRHRDEADACVEHGAGDRYAHDHAQLVRARLGSDAPR